MIECLVVPESETLLWLTNKCKCILKEDFLHEYWVIAFKILAVNYYSMKHFKLIIRIKQTVETTDTVQFFQF